MINESSTTTTPTTKGDEKIGVKKKQTQTMTVEQVLQHIGEYGRFQKVLDLLFFVMNISVSCQIFTAYFSTLTPSWQCRRNSSSCPYNGTLPETDMRRCDIPREAWIYTTARSYSLVTEFDLDCGKDWLLQLISSIYFIGWGVGGVVLGWFSDKYGRKKVMYPAIITTFILGFVTPFIPNIYAIIAVRFCIGFLNPGATLQCFILISEYVGSKHRPLAGIIVYLSMPCGYILVGVKAYLTQNWKLLHIVTTVPYVITLAFYRFVPESVKWLSLHGKTDQIKKILRRIAAFNKTEMPTGSYELEASDENVVDNTNILDIFRTRKLIMQTLAQAFVWLVTGIAYFGLSLASDDLGGSAYRDFIILSCFEVPALLLTIDFCTRFGRKPAAICPLFIGGISCIIVVFIPSVGKIKAFRILMGIFGKFCLSMTFDAVFTWSVEIYPTSLRSKGMGFLNSTCHIGSAAAPFIAKGLRPIARWLPFVAMGAPAVIGACIGMLLPETRVVKKENNNISSYDNCGMEKNDEICENAC